MTKRNDANINTNILTDVERVVYSWLHSQGFDPGTFYYKTSFFFSESMEHYRRLIFLNAIGEAVKIEPNTQDGRAALLSYIAEYLKLDRAMTLRLINGDIDIAVSQIVVALAILNLEESVYKSSALASENHMEIFRFGIARTLTMIKAFPPISKFDGTNNLSKCWHFVRKDRTFMRTKRFTQSLMDKIYLEFVTDRDIVMTTDRLGELRATVEGKRNSETKWIQTYIILKYMLTTKEIKNNSKIKFQGSDPYSFIWDDSMGWNIELWKI